MTELKLKRRPNGQIHCEMVGTESEISTLVCEAMIGNLDIAAIICGAIPSFLDIKKIDRAGFCKTIMDSVGHKTN